MWGNWETHQERTQRYWWVLSDSGDTEKRWTHQIQEKLVNLRRRDP